MNTARRLKNWNVAIETDEIFVPIRKAHHVRSLAQPRGMQLG